MNTSSDLTRASSSPLLTPRVTLRRLVPLFSLAASFALVACGTGSSNGDDPTAQGGSGNGANTQAGSAGRPVGTGGSSTPGGGSPSGGSSNGGAGNAPSGGTSSVAGAGSSTVGGASTIGSTDPSGQPTLPSGRGAIMPFTEYEAEAGTVMGGVQLGPTRAVNSTGDIAAEASNKKAVRLDSTGDYVEFKNLNPSNSIVVRYSIPDGGLDDKHTLSVYVDGKPRQKLNVTSRYSWSYGGPDDFANTGVQNNPGSGSPHHFFDESHALVGDIAVGALVRIQKDADDTASNYDIDLIDMEQVSPAPAAIPAGFVSALTCGVIPNDDKDDTASIQSCVTRTKSLYFPEGIYNINSKEISLQGVTLRGAGMWRSVFKGKFARFDCYAQGCKFYDFAIDGDTTQRDDSAPETGFTGAGMSGSVIEHIWVEHKKVGVWTGDNTSGLSIRNSRFRDLFADGINLACGTKNAVVEHTHVRNTGDDSFANWSLNTCGPTSGNVFRHVYAQLPWRANCFGIYGGGSGIEDSVCADTVQYPGLLLGRMFNANAFSATKVTGLSLIRTGGPQYGQQGALKLNAEQGPVQNIQISGVDIDSSTFSGIHLAGKNTIDTVSFDKVNITNPGGCGLLAQAHGAADASNVVVTGTGAGLCNEQGFNFIKGAGNSGW